MNKWLSMFEERAGIIEFDAGLPKEEAERRAFESVLVEFIAEDYPTAMQKFQKHIAKN